ncbi:helix-turn-helix domain-containing protein [Dietzia sp. CW19]|uniref:helix-turn-helix domain-containing protein n=1 Tax=Dietzia sp. CW19 TaxID=1630634 RepID=UPI0015F969AB|nr:XRE family transcriptional regulator [Dietzia sp. CW19]MBB1051309.1 helix-turn-helix domain-containing protein [Dietzia sp. CW19]
MDAKALGRRIAEARVAAGMSQRQLAEVLGQLDHTSVSKVESGTRRVSATEMFAIAATLDKPLQWFVMDEVPAVISRRTDAGFDPEVTERMDEAIELLADDMRSLMHKELISTVRRPESAVPDRHEDAERVAHEARRRAGLDNEPIPDILSVCERLGMYVFVGNYGESADGACVTVDGDSDTAVAAAVINSEQPQGRKRVTVAHELAHWLVGDAYDAHSSDSETMVKSVAIHFLIPREGAAKLWSDYPTESPRRRAIRIAGKYRVSWTATVNQLKNVGLIEERERVALAREVPFAGDFVAVGVPLPADDLVAPRLSPQFAAAVVRGYEDAKLTRKRALQMLRGSISDAELRPRDESPFEVIDEDA